MIRQSSVDLLSDTLFNIGVLQSATAHAHTNFSGHKFLYLFDHRSILSVPDVKGVNHAEEVIIIIITLFQENSIFGQYASLTYGPQLQFESFVTEK